MLLGVSPAKLESDGAIEQIVVFLGTVVSFSTCRTNVYVYLVGLSWILRLYRERAGFICSLGSTDFHFTL